MESLDLNIDNYNLPDILSLFNLPTLFNEADLKRAKLAVLKTHPDKCELPKEYFLFFTKAYRIVHQIYTIRHPATDEHYTQHVERTPRSSAVPSLRCVGKDTLSAPYTPIDAAAAAAGKSVVDYNRLMRAEGHRADADDEYARDTHERMKRRLDEMMTGTSNVTGTGAAKVSEFNRWFNEKFEQYRLKDDEAETGYDAWFRDTGDTADAATTAEDDGGSWADKVTRLNQKKQALRNKYALVERQELEYAGGGGGGGGGGYDLTRERPQEYSSGIFGNLRYEDLKKAHTETVIPVTEEDYYNTRRFNSINELQTFRDQSRRDLYKQTSKAEQERIYEQTRMRQEEEDTRRAFILAKQDEISRDIHKKLYSDIFRLEN
jgi:predicted HicB family RNase H-like nuclease